MMTSVDGDAASTPVRAALMAGRSARDVEQVDADLEELPA
jgi:hypothetical protein